MRLTLAYAMPNASGELTSHFSTVCCTARAACAFRVRICRLLPNEEDSEAEDVEVGRALSDMPGWVARLVQVIVIARRQRRIKVRPEVHARLSLLGQEAKLTSGGCLCDVPSSEEWLFSR
jgi:hypothetical protein